MKHNPPWGRILGGLILLVTLLAPIVATPATSAQDAGTQGGYGVG